MAEPRKQYLIDEGCDEQTLFLPPEYDGAILGIADTGSGVWVGVYDRTKVLQVLQIGLSVQDALEYYEYNIAGAYMGEHTPLFVDTLPADLS